MDDIEIKSGLIEQLIGLSKEAGEAILGVYNTNFDYHIKKDSSPLTKADTISNHIICEKLKILTPDIPILSEENSDIPFKTRSSWQQYWLIDPLDGTKEFIKRNGEFTVNIALIDNDTPVIGIIHAPALNETYWGSSVNGSFYSKDNNQKEKLCIEQKIRDVVRVVVSRSHPSQMLNEFLESIEGCNIITTGSSLKFCLIARGLADIYPRFGPTSEWDTAAGQAILKYSGGEVITSHGNNIKYNIKNDYINPNFLAHNNRIDLIKEWERMI